MRMGLVHYGCPFVQLWESQETSFQLSDLENAGSLTGQPSEFNSVLIRGRKIPSVVWGWVFSGTIASMASFASK